LRTSAFFIRAAALAVLPFALLTQTPAVAQPATPASATAPAAVGTDTSAAPAAAPAAKKSAAADAGTTDNPYGIEALWKGSDNIARSVLVILAIMSAGSWYILITKFLEQSKMNRHARTVDQKFWAQPTVSQAAGALEKNSAYRFIAEDGVGATNDHGGL